MKPNEVIAAVAIVAILAWAVWALHSTRGSIPNDDALKDLDASAPFVEPRPDLNSYRIVVGSKTGIYKIQQKIFFSDGEEYWVTHISSYDSAEDARIAIPKYYLPSALELWEQKYDTFSVVEESK